MPNIINVIVDTYVDVFVFIEIEIAMSTDQIRGLSVIKDEMENVHCLSRLVPVIIDDNWLRFQLTGLVIHRHHHIAGDDILGLFDAAVRHQDLGSRKNAATATSCGRNGKCVCNGFLIS